LSSEEIEAALAELPGWAYDGSVLRKTFEFATFDAAIQFMASAVGPINELNHHPTWSNTYDKVRVELSSHDVGAVTERDFALAALLDRLASD